MPGIVTKFLVTLVKTYRVENAHDADDAAELARMADRTGGAPDTLDVCVEKVETK